MPDNPQAGLIKRADITEPAKIVQALGCLKPSCDYVGTPMCPLVTLGMPHLNTQVSSVGLLHAICGSGLGSRYQRIGMHFIGQGLGHFIPVNLPIAWQIL